MNRRRSQNCIILAGAVGAILALTGAALGQGDPAGTLVDVGTFTVNVPDLDDWSVTVDKDSGRAEFSRSKQKVLRWFSSGAGGGTIMTVFKNRPVGGAPGLWLMSEQEMADNFRVTEQLGLFRMGLQITHVDTDAVDIEGKRYYRMHYVARMGPAESESMLHLYFPPEFQRTKEFYGFLISDSYVANSIFATKDMDQLKPLMRSLQSEGSNSTLPGVGGDLLRAAASGDSVRVKHLVESGANVNALPPDGRGPLALAALYGHESVVRYLVEHGADVSPMGAFEIYTPLSSAMLGREVRIAEFLLEKGASARERGDDPWPPLARAITMHFDSMFTGHLLAHGADPKLSRGWSPLMHAANEGLAPVAVQLIDNGATLDWPDASGQTALMLALNGGHTEAAEVLLTRGANPNASASDGASPLLYAVRSGDTTSMARLIQLGAKVNSSNKDGDSPLAMASYVGHLSCVQMLLSHGAEVDHLDKGRVTPLALAVYNGHVDCARLLLEKGADINAREKDGWTPLMWAAYRGDSATVQFLVARGARRDIENDDGDTALDLADDRDFDAIVEMLEKAERQR